MWTGADLAEKKTEYSVSSPLIETLGVSKVYNNNGHMISPVSDVTLRVGYGEFAVIFGRSGAGKSTLMNMLMGLESPDVGELYLKGSSLYDYTEEQRTTIRRKKISYLPQTTYWIDSMSVIDNVAMPLYLVGARRKTARTRAAQMLREVGLHDKLNARPLTLSSGQQQKAALARALVKEPWIIFADEPTAHLDTTSAEEVAHILVEATTTFGITIVMVTHDLEFLKLSKKWFFMQDGRLFDIQDRNHPFQDIREVMNFVEANEVNGQAS